MVNYKPFHEALNGLSNKYERAFNGIAEPVLSMNDPFALSFDEVDGQDRSEAYKYLRDNYDTFQSPFTIAAFELGKSIYTADRDLAENNTGRRFPLFPGMDLTEDLLKDNVIPYWEVTGLLKKVFNGEATLDWVAAIASRGIVDLSRSTTLAAGVADSKIEKIPQIATQAGACGFCEGASASMNNAPGGYKGKKIELHSGCRCSIVFEYLF